MSTTGELADEYLRAYLGLTPGAAAGNPLEAFYAAHERVRAQEQATLVAMVQYVSLALCRTLRDRATDTGRTPEQIWAEVEMTLRMDAALPLPLRDDDSSDQ